jgi:diguanylate cyclase (GGDEF)-like protein/putative nucleotidyltransferase with HDIG domain
MMSQGWPADWVEPLLLAVLAGASSQIKLKLPGAEQSVSLAIFPVTAAISLQPAVLVFLVAAAAVCVDFFLDRKKGQWTGFAGELAGTALAAFTASLLHSFSHGALGVGSLLALVIAVGGYFAAGSAVSAAFLGIAGNISPRVVWKNNHFWTIPVYLLAPAVVAGSRGILQSSSVVESGVGLLLACLVALYLKIYMNRLWERERRAEDLHHSKQRAIETLAEAIEAKDGGSAGRLQRVRRHARQLAEAMGCMEADIRALESAATLHDVGKVVVPDYILNKPSRLTQKEFNAMASHVTAGAEIISRANLPRAVEQIVLSHHEHWDGSGYPNGIAGERIPLLARILTLVDCFNALLTDRPYREALSIEQALEVLSEERGAMLDPRAVDVFMTLLPGMRDELTRELEEERSLAALAAGPAGTLALDSMGSASHEHSPELRSLQRLAAIPEQLVAFYEILRNLGADLNFDKSSKECLRILRQTIPYDKAGIFVLDQGQYVLLQAEGLPDHCVSRLALPAEMGVAAQAAATRLPVVADAPPSELIDGRVPRYLDDLCSSVVAPLIVEERVIGMLMLGSVEPGTFTAQHGEFLSLITPKLATTVTSWRALQKVYLEAETDEMTNLPNARAAFRKLEAELKRAERHGQTVAVLYMDLDGLKPVNDSYGHAAGDKLLLDIGRNLRAHLRSYDFLGRVGGDEFMAIVPGIAKDGLDAKVLAIKQSLASKPIMVTEDVYLRPKMSVGASLFPVDASDSEELIYLADRRMYRDKTHSRAGSQFERIASAP